MWPILRGGQINLHHGGATGDHGGQLVTTAWPLWAVPRQQITAWANKTKQPPTGRDTHAVDNAKLKGTTTKGFYKKVLTHIYHTNKASSAFIMHADYYALTYRHDKINTTHACM